MPNSLLGLLALVAVTLLVLTQSRTRVLDTADTYQGDSILQARGLAVSILERLAAYPFDGGEGGVAAASGADAYSPRASFGVGGLAGATMDELLAHTSVDDLDDFHGATGATLRQVVTLPSTGAPEVIEYAVQIEVHYAARDASGSWQRVTDPTLRTHHKLVSLSLDNPALSVPLRFGRIYAAS